MSTDPNDPVQRKFHLGLCLAAAALVAPTWSSCAAEEQPLEQRLRELKATVLSGEAVQGIEPQRMLGDDVRRRRREANQRSTAAWRQVDSVETWEKLRDGAIAALRRSLGRFPHVPENLHARVTGTLEGEGFLIQNVLFQTRPDLWVTANLYLPSDPPDSMPGILLCHSHHNPKTQGELQDMGMTWARLGCAVLVMDQLGHGERRQHSFRTADDYPGSFRVGRQDYYFRYNVGMQLHLVGESLIGWMAWDLMRGVDLLLEQPGVDPERIILIGAVAGGGDPTAVTGALDRRIAAVVPFNFGGPQPENRYPLPEDAELSFNYAGGGSWESTRNLRLSCRDGFLPWVIVGAVAPRRLIYAHEFAWDHEHDPVWDRFGVLYNMYGVPEFLASAHGMGAVTGSGPGNTHCNNVGPVHREQIYPRFQEWFGMPAPAEEYRNRLSAEELRCITPEVAAELNPWPVHKLAARLAAARVAAARGRLGRSSAADRREQLRRDWAALLGDVEPKADPRVASISEEQWENVTLERVVLEVEPGIVVPVLLLLPKDASPPTTVVVGIAQQGKVRLLQERSELLAHLLRGGAAVCLPDVRGTGETQPGDSRGRRSAATSLSSSELMLGQTLVGSRLRDLRSVLRYLRTRDDLQSAPVILWGESLAQANDPEDNLAVPLDADPFPRLSEPLGGLLALFGALFEPDVKAVYLHGGLTGYASVLDSPFCYLPHDVIVPGALTAGDLADVAAALAPRPLWMSGLVDGLNRQSSDEQLAASLQVTRTAYAAADSAAAITTERPSAGELAGWMLRSAAK